MLETYAARGFIEAGGTYVMPHHYLEDEVRQVSWDLPGDLPDAAGSAWSSAHDMSLWAQFILRDGITASGDRLITEESMAEMFEPHQLSSPDDFYPTIALTEPHWRTYGLGWFQQDFQGRMINFHTGSLSGLIAIIGVDFERDTAVVVLGNQDHAEMRHAILWHVMDDSPNRRDWNKEIYDLYDEAREQALAEREEAESSRLEDTTPSLSLDAYIGTYNDDVVGEIVVNQDDDGLRLDTDNLSFRLNHWHLDTFQITLDEVDFRTFGTFAIDSAGNVSSIDVLGTDFQRKK